MSNLRRTLILILFTCLLLAPLLALLVLLLRNLPVDANDFWTKPENRAGFIIGISSSIVYAIGASIFIFFRRAILRWSKAFVLRGRSIDEERNRVKQEQLYLENFVERFRKDFPWEVNKYTDLEAIQEDLEKQAHRVQPLRRNLPNAEESSVEGNVRARVNVRSFLRNEKGPLMLKGEPGTGKTLTIRRFAVDQAENALKALPGEVMLPIYIFLGSYTQTTANGEPEAVYDFLQHYLEEEYPASGFLREQLTEYLLQGRLLLLFDGLNELPLDEYLPRYKKLEEFVLRKYPKNKAIFTCRTIRYTSLYKFNTIVISDLANNQIKRFITAYLGGAAAEMLYRELTTGDGFMLRICRNPFMLQMLVRRDPNRPIPQSPAQLFDEYVHDELRSIAKDSEDMIELLRQLAFAMQKDGKFAGTVTSEWLRTQLPDIPHDDLLLIARNSQLIDYAPEKIGFSHQILQEYFAALALKKDWEESKDLESFFTDYRWDDTVLVCAGLIEETEKFLKEIWSPGKTSPDTFWLAMKAVGISGRYQVSNEYYNSLIEEAKKNLGLHGRAMVIGLSPTVLAVDTVKALSYIDDDQTADLLNTVLDENEGWLRELCIQTLGSSRNPHARSLLRSTIINIRPFEDIFLASPYFSRRVWLVILTNSVLSFKRLPDYILSVLTGKIKFLVAWSSALFWVILICLLFIVIDILLRRAHFFAFDLQNLSGRLLSIIIFLIILRYHFDELAKIVRSSENKKTKQKSLRNELTWVDLLLLLPVLLLWFYPTEMLLLLEFLTIYTWLCVYFLAIFTRLKHPPYIASLIYYNSISAVVLFAIVIAWGRLFLRVQNITHGNPSLNSVLGLATVIRHAILFLISPIIYQVCQILFFLIIVATIVACLTTWVNYWRLQRYRNAYLRKNNQDAALHIKDIALKPSGWHQIRQKAFKELRLIELPFSYIEDFESLMKDQRDYNIQRELERTIYELQARAREKDREGSTVLKRHIRTLANQGMDHRKLEQYEEALADFNQAITLDEKDAELIVERGITYLQMDHYQEALADFNLALSLNQKDIKALDMRGETYRQMNRYQEALADYDRIITLYDHLTWPLVDRGNIYRQMERYREALNNYTQALALNKRYAPAFFERGLTYLSLGKYQEALADLNRVLALDEKKISALGNRGITYKLMERYQEALADFDRIIAMDEKNQHAIATRGQLKREMGHYHEALTDLNHAITLDEKDDWAVAKRGEIYLLTGYCQEALADFDRAIALDENWPWYRYDRALAFMIMGNTSDFESNLHTAIELAQDRLNTALDKWEVRLDIALFTLVAGNITDAESQFHQLVTDCPLCATLQFAMNDLKDFLRIQPSNESAQHIYTQLRDRVDELKRIPIQ